MNWYWIVLIVLGYLVMWIITGVIWAYYVYNNDNEVSTFIGLLWPGSFPLIILVGVFALVSKSIEWFIEYSRKRKKDNDNHTKTTNA